MYTLSLGYNPFTSLLRGIFFIILFGTTLFATSNSHLKLLLNQNLLLKSEITLENSQNSINRYSVSYIQQQNFYETTIHAGYAFLKENIVKGLDMSFYLGVGGHLIVQKKSSSLFPHIQLKLLLNRVFLPRVIVSYSLSSVKQSFIASTKLGLPLPTAFYDVSIAFGYEYERFQSTFIDFESSTLFTGLDIVF